LLEVISKVASQSEVWKIHVEGSICRAIEHAINFEAEVESITATWREALGRIRAGSATALLIEAIPGAPILTVDGAADLIGRSWNATNQAIDRLEEAGVLRRTEVGHRNRALVAPNRSDPFTAPER
jgi:predicted transcriptional regulator